MLEADISKDYRAVVVKLHYLNTDDSVVGIGSLIVYGMSGYF